MNKETTFLLALCRRSPLGEAKWSTKIFKWMSISTERPCMMSQCVCSWRLIKSCGGSSMKGPSQASFCRFSTRRGQTGPDPPLYVHLERLASFVWLEARDRNLSSGGPWQHFLKQSIRLPCQQVHFIVQTSRGLFNLPTPKPCPPLSVPSGWHQISCWNLIPCFHVCVAEGMGFRGHLARTALLFDHPADYCKVSSSKKPLIGVASWPWTSWPNH